MSLVGNDNLEADSHNHREALRTLRNLRDWLSVLRQSGSVIVSPLPDIRSHDDFAFWERECNKALGLPAGATGAPDVGP